MSDQDRLVRYREGKLACSSAQAAIQAIPVSHSHLPPLELATMKRDMADAYRRLLLSHRDELMGFSSPPWAEVAQLDYEYARATYLVLQADLEWASSPSSLHMPRLKETAEARLRAQQLELNELRERYHAVRAELSA